ncbi:hypothetical protein CF15_02705 [Pyrodictium occultum]|uniref:Probable membrane transporter protein n=1 Tax=Pyrodictium occultum TaxID=2309 RepID=A0A0V8RUK2_PYROC|nr:sulfite exporter TauE/SafE family protein [Pyrodictium occultum]KSW11743.1 hypothetical protein CF15_02705 [Pyrodictium occultum]
MNPAGPLAVGFLAGFLGTLLGIGGGVFIVPLLVLAGVDIKRAAAASLVAILGTSAGGLRRLHREGLVDVWTAVFLESASTTGAFLGAVLVGRVESRLLVALFGILLIASAAGFVVEEGVGRRGGRRSLREVPGSGRAVGWLASFAAGMVSAVLGIGGGVIKVPVLVLLLRFDMKVAVATSKMMVGLTALAGVLGHALGGRLDAGLALPLLAGTYTGATLSSRVLLRVGSRALRRLALAYYLAMGAYMLARGLGLA